MVERIGGAPRVRAFASPTAYEAFLRAELAAARGTPAGRAEALALLHLAATADPSDPWLVVRQAELRLDDGDVAGARSDAMAATERFPEAAVAWICLARVAQRAGDPDAAFRAAQRALALEPNDPDVRVATAEVTGADPAALAHARRTAPQADGGDRVTADRVFLDPAERLRRAARTHLRLEAGRLRARGAWAAVDRTLGPAARRDPRDSVDRVTVIEARVRDGRPRDAVPWVAALRVGAEPGQVEAARRARLWLLVLRPDLAEEEATEALRERPEDALARRVRAEAWCAQGHLGRCVEALAAIGVDADDDPLAEPWEAPWAGRPDAARGPGMAFAQVRIVALRALEQAGLVDEAEAVTTASIARLAAPEQALARDTLRVAWAHTLQTHHPTRPRSAWLDAVESRWGVHRRGAMRAHEDTTGAALDDLRVRMGDAHEDALADAWRALLCALPARAARCEAGEAEAARARAEAGAPEAAVTLRARSVAAGVEPDAARTLQQRAAHRDPRSPWNLLLVTPPSPAAPP